MRYKAVVAACTRLWRRFCEYDSLREVVARYGSMEEIVKACMDECAYLY